jgi:putative peptidoglycan lipid II flippase
MTVKELHRRALARLPWKHEGAAGVGRRILGATFLIAGLTLAVKLAAMVKDIAVAASFGTSAPLEAFLVAFIVPTFVTNVVGASFQAALMPVYIRVRDQEGRASAQRLCSSVVCLSTGILTVVTLLLAVSGPFVLTVLRPSDAGGADGLTCGLFYIFLPTIVINGVGTIAATMLNAGERFALVASAAVVVPIATVLPLAVVPAEVRIQAMAWGLVVGVALQVGLLAWGLWRQGWTLWPRWYGMTPAVRSVLGQYLPLTAGAVLMSSTIIVDQAMAARLGGGSVAVLSYANKLVAVILNVGTTALGTAIMPYFARLVAEADWGRVRALLRSFTLLILGTTVPVTLAACLLSEPIIGLLYQRGAFTSADAHWVSQVQVMYLLQLPFYTTGILFVRLIECLQASKVLMWGTVISAVLNLALDYLLMQVLGVAGIALSTSLVYVAACLYLAVMLRRKLRSVEMAQTACA